MRNRTKSAVLGLAVLMSGLLPAPGDPAALVARTAAELPRWIAGCWSGRRGGETFSERWVVADAATMIGVAHTLKDGSLSAFEFLRIVVRGDALVYVAQPGGAPPTEFSAPAANRSATAVTFANPVHDFPKRVGYRRSGADGLTAWIDGGVASRSPIEYAMTKANCEP